MTLTPANAILHQGITTKQERCYATPQSYWLDYGSFDLQQVFEVHSAQSQKLVPRLPDFTTGLIFSETNSAHA